MRPRLAFAISRNWSAIHDRAAKTPRFSPSCSENVLRVPNATSRASSDFSRSAETFATAAAITGSGAGGGAAGAAGARVSRATAASSARIKAPLSMTNEVSQRVAAYHAQVIASLHQ